jgi:hypothetical protein
MVGLVDTLIETELSEVDKLELFMLSEIHRLEKRIKALEDVEDGKRDR